MPMSGSSTVCCWSFPASPVRSACCTISWVDSTWTLLWRNQTKIDSKSNRLHVVYRQISTPRRRQLSTRCPCFFAVSVGECESISLALSLSLYLFALDCVLCCTTIIDDGDEVSSEYGCHLERSWWPKKNALFQVVRCRWKRSLWPLTIVWFI